MTRTGSKANLFLTAVSVCLGLAVPASAQSLKGPEPVHVFLTPPLSVDELWKKLDRPDFVLLTGDDYQKLLKRTGSPNAPGESDPRAVTPSSIEISGAVGVETAALSLNMTFVASAAGRVSVKIPLSGLAAIVSVREGGKDLPFSLGPNGVGTIELEGQGRHEIVLDCIARISRATEENRISLPIVVCPSTSLRLKFDGKIDGAAFSEREFAEVRPAAGGAGSTLVAKLTPRDNLSLSWRSEVPGEARLPSVINADGEYTLDVGSDNLTIRSRWRITAARGTTDAITITLDPADELTELELEGRPIPNRISRDEGGSKVTVALPESLRPGKSIRLMVAARRKLKPGASNRVRFEGFRFDHSQIQTGTAAVSRSRPIFVEGTPGRSLRRIDPRAELPADSPSRAGTLLAYQFQDQPFDLTLAIEPTPPRVRPEPRTTVLVGADQVSLDCWIDYQTTKGQVYDLAVDLGPGVEIDNFGPPDLIEAAEYAGGGGSPKGNGERRLILHLTAKARELGDFRVHLVGRHALNSKSKPVIQLFRPQGENSLGGMVALIATPGVDVLPISPEPKQNPPFAKLDLAATPTEWIWPKAITNDLGAAVTWLRHTGDASQIPVEVIGRTRLLTHDNSVQIEIQRRSMEVVQDLQIAIPYGTIRNLDVIVPREIERWVVDSPKLQGNDLLGIEKDGTKRYRLSLEADEEKLVRFRFLYTVALTGKEEAHSTGLVWIRPINSTATAESIRVAAQTSVDVDVEAKGWDVTRLGLKAGPRARERFRLTKEDSDAAAPTLKIKADQIVALPELVAERSWLKSSVSTDGSRVTIARYAIETHGSSIDIALPPGAVWVLVQVNEEHLPEVEKREAPDEYRIILPERAQTGFINLSLAYNEAGSRERRAFTPPRLIGGLVQQTYWEVLIPGIELAMGVPEGWNDENLWTWSGYVFKRTPSQSGEQLEAWLTGQPVATKPSIGEGKSDSHAYLFSRVGTPPAMSLRVHSKAFVLGLCTGVVAMLGVASVWLKITAALQLAAFATAGFGIALAADAGVAFTLFQSSIFGILLTVSASFLQRMIDRRPGSRKISRERSGSTLTRVPNPTPNNAPAPLPLGSDDSTAIRLRTTASDEKLILTPESVLPFGSTARTAKDSKHE